MTEKTGHLILVVGPSGAGKDSVISGAKSVFTHDPNVVFPRRVVTRKANIQAEDHESLTKVEFDEAAAAGAFFIWWIAHGNSYGIPISVATDLANGRTVVFNCSRDVVPEAASRNSNTTVVEITAPQDVLVERIVARGRETVDQAIARTSRKVQAFPPPLAIVRIDNIGPLQVAVQALCVVVSR